MQERETFELNIKNLIPSQKSYQVNSPGRYLTNLNQPI